MLVLGFKRCKSNTGIYYYYDKKTKALVIAIIYIDSVCFMGVKSWSSGLLGLTSTNQVVSSSVLAHKNIEFANRKEKTGQWEDFVDNKTKE